MCQKKKKKKKKKKTTAGSHKSCPSCFKIADNLPSVSSQLKVNYIKHLHIISTLLDQTEK